MTMLAKGAKEKAAETPVLPAEVLAAVAGLTAEQWALLATLAAANDTSPPRKLYGLKEVSAYMAVSRTTVKEFYRRERDPLPLEHGHRGMWAYATALRDWMRRQNVPYGIHLAKEKAEREKRARRTEAAREKRARLRPARQDPRKHSKAA